MSIMKYEKKDFAKLLRTLRMDQGIDSRADPLTWKDKLEAEYYADSVSDQTKKDVIENKLNSFVNRLFVAHQVAYNYQYYHHEDVNGGFEKLEEEDLETARPYDTRKRLYEDLRMIRYNILMNNGNEFISKEDKERLNAYISNLGHKVIQDLEKTAERKDKKIEELREKLEKVKVEA